MGTIKNGREKVNKLNSIVEVGTHVGLIETVLCKYAYKEEKLQKLIEKTKERQKDNLLNMSIIGEFSSGKSSFINALLRKELLLSCSLQGTTVANTVIEYAPECRVEIKDQDGQKKILKFENVEEMAEKIEGFTTDPDFAKNIYSVNIYLPSESIKDKIRIIDTPGTNATEVWHEDVTKKAINGLSDASVILIDSTKPFPETICNFVLTNLKKFLPQCVFVLTKFDVIEPEEREMILKYSRLKVKEIFGLDNALILPYSSLAALEGKKGDEFYDLSADSEEKLFDFLVKQRTVAQMKKTMAYINLMYGVTAKHIKSVYDGCVEDLSRVENPDKTKLNTYITYQKSRHTVAFEKVASQNREAVMNMIYKKNFETCERIKKVIASKTSFEELNQYLTQNLFNVCKVNLDDMILCAKNGTDKIVKQFADQIGIFYQSFFKTFNINESAEMKKETILKNIGYIKTISVDYTRKIEEGKTLVRRLIMNENRSNFEMYKRKVQVELAIYIKALFNRISYDIKVQLENISPILSNNLVFEIGNCSFYPDKQVDKKKAVIKDKMNSINRDLRLIKEKQEMLLVIETQLDSMI